MSETAQTFRKYAALVTGALNARAGDSFRPAAEGDTAVQVERGTVYAAALVGRPRDVVPVDRIDRLVRLASGGPPGAVVVVDAAGHHRPVYRPLLVYAWLQSYKLLYEVLPRAEFGKWDEALRAWCDLLEAELSVTRLPEGGTPAGLGGAAAESAWTALALFSAGRLLVRDAWTDLASDTFGRLTRSQSPQGTFLLPGPADSPETWWYHELVILHAAASYAVQAEDRPVASAVARATAYHLRETQPDHATSQPWALFAFVWNENTRPLADQLLHAAAAQQPGGADGVSLILLADALYCLRLFGPAGA